MFKLIDISGPGQGAVDWDAIEQSYNAGQIGGVIIRAGYSGGGVDDQFALNRDEVRRRGIPHTFYYFAYPGRENGSRSAQAFSNIVGQLQVGESVALDMEDEPTYGRRLVGSDVGWALEFLNRAQALFGVKPLAYMNSDVKSRFDWKPVVDGDYGLWLANYGTNNGQPNTEPGASPWAFWAIWQYTSRGNIAGISPVDVNQFNGEKADYLKYGLQGSAPAPAPAPSPAPPPTPSDTYTVHAEQNGYVNSNDAAAKQNSNSRVPANVYSIFNTSKGMVNVTRQPGAPGWWINPGEGGSAPQPPSSNVYTVVSGDTVDGISGKFGLSKANNYAAFRSMNPNSGHNGQWQNIWPGDKVRVP